MPVDLPADRISSWVHVVGPWTGTVVMTTAQETAEELCRSLLGPAAPPVLEHEDVADAFIDGDRPLVRGTVQAALRHRDFRVVWAGTFAWSTGTYADYSDWAKEQDGAPSGATLRQRFPWAEVKQRAESRNSSEGPAAGR